MRLTELATSETPQKDTEFEKLRAPIQDIIAFANTLDERYREKCFEVLLISYLRKNTAGVSVTTEPVSLPKAELESGVTPLPLPIRAFMTQNNITEGAIRKLFLIEKGEVVPTYKIAETKKATAQIQLALLTALKNALIDTTTMFEFSVKDVRELCKEHGVYDAANFTANFKNNATLFNNLTTDEEHVKLTPDGKTELAEAIATVSKQ